MADSKQNIEERKRELKEQLEEIEGSLDDSVHGMREDVTDLLNPRKIIKKYPLQSLGISFIVGFLAAGKDDEKTSSRENKAPSLLELVWDEAKKDISKKAVRLFLNYLDTKTSAHESGTADNSSDTNRDKEQ